MKRFWICREENGLFSPFRCTEENVVMRSCLQTCGRDESAFSEFRTRRLQEIEAGLLARVDIREKRAV